jgi:UDP-4-amino-4-deoxy-L-arabinose-oxoglutarate aminotransferase
LMTNAALVAEKLSPRTKLIVPVHFAGAPVDLDPLRALAAQHGIPLVEDAAHAAGTRYQGEAIGQRGTSIFSFHPIKNITSGEGGMFCAEDAALLAQIRSLKFHGLGVDAYDRTLQGRSPQAEVLEPGYKYNLTDIAAVLGLGQLARLDEFIQKRAALAAYYAERLTELDEIQPLAVPSYPHRHAWHLYIVRLVSQRLSRDALMAALKARNIGTGLHFRAAHEHKYYREQLPQAPESLPQTSWNSARICSLPLFPDMQPDDIDDVINALKEVLITA